MKSPRTIHFVNLLTALALAFSMARAADFTSTWTSGGGGDTGWNTLANWNTPGAPGTFPNNVLSPSVITYDAVQTGGISTLTQAITIEKYNLSGTNTGGGHDLTLNGLFTWTGNSTLDGTGNVNANGGIQLGSGIHMMNTRVLNSSGEANWTAGSFWLTNATINNTSSGTWKTNFDGSMTNSSGGTFNNEGTFEKNGGTGITSFDNGVAFNNSGAVHVNSGTLQISGGGTSTGDGTSTHGAFVVGSGNTLTFGSSYSVDGGSSITGSSGTVSIPSGGGGNLTLAVGGTYNVGTTSITGTFSNGSLSATTGNLSLNGTLRGTGTLALTGTGSWSGGRIIDTGILKVESTGSLTISSNVQLGNNDGRKLNNFGTTTFDSGTMTMVKGSGTEIQNFGLFKSGGNATFQIATGGALDPVFQNYAGGVFEKTGVGTTTVFGPSVNFNNNAGGEVRVLSGTLQLGGSGSSNGGTFSISGGATLEFSNSSYTADASSSISGTGTLFVRNGSNLTSNGAYNVGTTKLGATLTLNNAGTTGVLDMTANGGNLAGTGNLTVNTLATWSGFGTVMKGNGTTTIGADAILNLSSGSATLGNNDTRKLDNYGTINISGGTLNMTNGTGTGVALNNYHTTPGTGVINATGNNTFALASGGAIGPTIDNGTGAEFNKSGAGTSTSVSAGINFTNHGTVNVSGGTLSLGFVAQHNNSTTLNGGTWNVSNGATLAFTSGSNITTSGPATSVTLDGAGSTFNRFTTALNNNQGSLTLKNNRDLTTAGAYANSGTTRVEDSSTVMTIGTSGASAYTQTAGQTILVNGAMIDASAFNLNGGSLTGNGTIDAPLTSNGTIAPGASPGQITVNGGTILGANSTLAMEIGAGSPGLNFDVLTINGTLMLDGDLRLALLSNFGSITPADTFAVVTSTSAITGLFANISPGQRLITEDLLGSFIVNYGGGSPFGSNQVVLSDFLNLAPEPSRAMLVMAGLCSMALRRRRASTTAP